MSNHIISYCNVRGKNGIFISSTYNVNFHWFLYHQVSRVEGYIMGDFNPFGDNKILKVCVGCERWCVWGHHHFIAGFILGLINMGIMTLSVIMVWSTYVTTLNSNSSSEHESANEATIRNGGANPSTNGWGFMSMFNIVVESFQELWKNYKRVQIEMLQSL